MAKYLVLCGPTNRETRFRLAGDADLAEVQQRLDQARPEEFVTVAAALEDELAPLQLRVQPHAYAAWFVLDLPEGSGLPAPMQAVRARQADIQQTTQQIGMLGEVMQSLRKLGQQPEQ